MYDTLSWCAGSFEGVGLFILLHHDAIPDDMLAEVRVISHRHNYYSAQLLNHHLAHKSFTYNKLYKEQLQDNALYKIHGWLA